MSKTTKMVYVPLDWQAACKAVGGKVPKVAASVFGPVAGKVTEVSTLIDLYAAEVRNSPGFGKRGGKVGEADKKSAQLNVGWWVKNVFPKVPA
jgi:hypothetical protein